MISVVLHYNLYVVVKHNIKVTITTVAIKSYFRIKSLNLNIA